ncbi:MAG: hypothetical protein M3Y59_25470 [Myxococcota bacterium]|nr:hypothetical protein [Myxococcota bacterium]
MEADGCETNLDTDEQHCGDCQTVCSGPVNGYPECIFGACIQKCNTGTDRVCNVQGKDTCVPNNSTAHCGGCDNPCPASAPRASAVICSGTDCVAVCHEGWRNCNGSLIDGCEQDITTQDHCGSCATTACAACVDGQCCSECGGAICCGACIINSKGLEICN